MPSHPPITPHAPLLRTEWGAGRQAGEERPAGLQTSLPASEKRGGRVAMGAGLPLVLLLTLVGSSQGAGESGGLHTWPPRREVGERDMEAP